MNLWLRQFGKTLLGLQLRTTVLLGVLVLAATGLTAATCLRVSSRITLYQTKRHARDLARSFASTTVNAVAARDREALLAVAEGSLPGSELAYLIFTDQSGNILASLQSGAGNITHLMLDDVKKVSVEPIDHPQLTFHSDQGARIDVVYPVYAARALSADGSVRSTVGYVRLGVSLAASETRIAALVRNTCGLAIGIALLMVPIGYEVVRNIVSPLNKLGDAARSFAAGRLDARVTISRGDEIGRLADAFNGMADALADSHANLTRLNAELEDRVERRTTALEAANRRFREMAARDSLTGLYNRRHFNDLMAQLFAESSRYHTDLTCMMIDLDNFKRVNDSLGHQVGDDLLRMTAGVIQHCIRESDVAVRYGGDEFIVLLPQTNPDDARSSAERIIRQFRTELIRQLPEASISSLSIGLASRVADQPAEAINLIQLADEALYLAKAGGKNRITVVRAGADHPGKPA